MKMPTIKFIIYNTSIMIAGFYFFGNHFLISTFPQSSFLIPLLCIPIALLMILFLPKKVNNNLKNLLNNPIMRFISFIYLYISTVLFIVIAIYTLTSIFYKSSTFIEAGFIIALMIGLIGTFPLKNIYNVSIILAIVSSIINLIILTNTSSRDFILIKNLNFIVSKPYMVVVILFLLLDGLLFYFYNVEKDSINIKNGMMISITIACIIATILIFNNYTYYTYQYLQIVDFPGFMAIMNYLGPEFIEHFDLLILSNIVLWIILKGSINTRFAITILRKGVKPLPMLFVISLGFIAVYIIYRLNLSFNSLITYIGLFLSTLIILIYFYLLFLGRNNHYERKKT